MRNGVLGAALIAALSACGGSGDSGGTTTPVAPGVTLAATQSQTLAGGKTLPLTASASDSSAITWTLAAGAAGSLSAASGATVSYVPPATVAANTPVTVNANAGGASKSLTLTVFPEPGAPGLSIISGRVNSDLWDPETDGPVATARFRESRQIASDLSGNLYVIGTCLQTQTRMLGLSLRKIGTDNTVSTLASCEKDTWFGKADTDKNTDKIYIPTGGAVDRAGNIYVSTYFGPATAGNTGAPTLAVYKITPQGGMTVFAGVEGTHTAALVDGKGGAARFLAPEVVGIDAEDNLYLYDKDRTVVRKITPAAEVSTITALPASLFADLNGNTYRADRATGAIIQTTPAGVESTIANAYTLPGVLPGMTPEAYGLVRTGPATYALIVGNGATFSNEAIVKLVVPH